jgi:S1-C subfamily serine protease
MAGSLKVRRLFAAIALVLVGALAGHAAVLPTITGAAAGPVLNQGNSFNLTAQEQQLTSTSQAVAREVVQVENVGVGLGSGVIATSDGYIVTNNHVVEGGSQYYVTLSSGQRLAARLVGTSPTDDLAVLKINKTGLAAARFGNSDKLMVGQIVLAVGNPLGLGETVTNGVVSAVQRTVSEGTGAYLPHAIQTSAPINPGNSGGALVSLDGQVVGIPTLGVGSPEGGAAQGIGFAIPSNRVVLIANQLITTGKVIHTDRAYLGISTQDASQADSSNPFQPSQPTASGVQIAEIGQGTPAARAGLQVGDVIVNLAGHTVQNTDSLFSILADLHVGEKVGIVVQRTDATTGNATTVHLQVTLGELPANPQS